MKDKEKQNGKKKKEIDQTPAQTNDKCCLRRGIIDKVRKYSFWNYHMRISLWN